MAHDSTQLNRSQMQSRQKIRIVAKNLNAAKNLTLPIFMILRLTIVKTLKFLDHNFNSANFFENWQLLSFPGVGQSKIRILAKNLNFDFCLILWFQGKQWSKILTFEPTISVQLKVLKIAIFTFPLCKLVKTENFNLSFKNVAQNSDFCLISWFVGFQWSRTWILGL